MRAGREMGGGGVDDEEAEKHCRRSFEASDWMGFVSSAIMY